ncbi:MAG: DUF5682 family protein [Pseudomonadales bacterium]|nr:DUF5682 family protein [Pseudomonadales bacterium]
MENTANSAIHYLGVRHHGPGSANRVVAALDALRPRQVLIEGPSDCTELLPMLAQRDMTPPVALLAYVADDPACSLYYPFAEFSPEYQACCWAVRNSATVAFIDMPVSIQLAQMLAQRSEPDPEDVNPTETDAFLLDDALPLSTDPIGALATLAGYQDGESWWSDLIEQNADDDVAIFATVEAAMTTLREHIADADEDEPVAERNRYREAFMRLEISKAHKAGDGPTAVICGAWHVPELKAKHSAKADRECLKNLPKKHPKSKLKQTWIPWTSPRLASQSGYGAGVSAPMWYKHIWQHRNNPNALEHWLGHVTAALRAAGHVVSTASIIEAVRLCTSLAAVRNRPNPGFEEVRDASIACLCFGESLQWTAIEQQVLLGHDVGEIPENAPLVPLLEDLQRLQKSLKLKPEALDRELSLDLRATAGLQKSILLRRLRILDVSWGRLTDPGKSRGTFRERWILRWEPEFAVKLLENLIYGSTIEQAANTKVCERLQQPQELAQLANTVQHCLEAQLDDAAEYGLKRIDEQAAHTSDAIALLTSLAPLVNLSRYGTARSISLTHIAALVDRLAIQAALALPLSCRNLSDEEANHFCQSISAAHQAVQLANLQDDILSDWWEALLTLSESPQTSFQIAGLSARLCYVGQQIAADKLQIQLQRALSPARPAADAARYFEGFFAGSVQRLIYDDMLLGTVESWLIHLEDETFIMYLPLFRRVFSGLDSMERKRLLQTILEGRQGLHTEKTLNAALLPHWPDHLQRIGKLIQRDKTWTQ